jgi:hypothetical protein
MAASLREPSFTRSSLESHEKAVLSVAMRRGKVAMPAVVDVPHALVQPWLPDIDGERLISLGQKVVHLGGPHGRTACTIREK